MGDVVVTCYKGRNRLLAEAFTLTGKVSLSWPPLPSKGDLQALCTDCSSYLLRVHFALDLGFCPLHQLKLDQSAQWSPGNWLPLGRWPGSKFWYIVPLGIQMANQGSLIWRSYPKFHRAAGEKAEVIFTSNVFNLNVPVCLGYEVAANFPVWFVGTSVYRLYTVFWSSVLLGTYPFCSWTADMSQTGWHRPPNSI